MPLAISFMLRGLPRRNTTSIWLLSPSPFAFRKVCISYFNGRMVGLMRGNVTVSVGLPESGYEVTVSSVYKWIEPSVHVRMAAGKRVCLTFDDCERQWSRLFNLDLVLCLAKRVLYLGEP